VLSRRELLETAPRWLVKAELRSGRWQRPGRQSVVVHNGPLDPAARRLVGVLEVGPRAALDGVTALQHAGITALSDDVVHVIAPKGSSPRRVVGVRVHESRRFDEADVATAAGIRVVRPAVAAVHAALWARTDREASYVLLLVVQQRLAHADEVATALSRVRRHPRRRLLQRLVLDLVDGVRSLGELDVALAMRRRGLPEPDRQAVRRRPSGTVYLDCRFGTHALTLEIDGGQHDDPEHRLADLLRDLDQVSDGDTVLRIPLVAWRLGAEQVLDRLAEVFRSRGWRSAA
jgi:very-short-patch-repair endonuclease